MQKKGGKKVGFFDEIGKKVTDAGQKTLQKTKEMSETVRLNSLISEEEKKMNATYCQIGTLYVSVHKDDCEEAFVEMVNSVLDSRQKISEYQEQIQDIKGVQRCEKCGAEVQRGAAFCSSCGATMTASQTESADELVQCDSCGTMVKKGTRFCVKCGEPMVQSEPIQNTDEERTAAENSEKVCQNCGAKIVDDSAFCTECGAKLEKTENI